MVETATEEIIDGVILRDIDREEYEFPASAYGAKVKLDKDGNPTSVMFPKKRILKFAKPGGRVGAKRLFTVKAEKADGTVIQIPLEGQINNNVASPENYLGLRFYEKRGVNIFWDFATSVGLFCPSWDCWAAWNPQFSGFCCPAHKEITSPEQANSVIGEGATTSGNVWSV